eukprot:14087705-Ditylum_brightwellii.AAC.1
MPCLPQLSSSQTQPKHYIRRNTSTENGTKTTSRITAGSREFVSKNRSNHFLSENYVSSSGEDTEEENTELNIPLSDGVIVGPGPLNGHGEEKQMGLKTLDIKETKQPGSVFLRSTTALGDDNDRQQLSPASRLRAAITSYAPKDGVDTRDAITSYATKDEVDTRATTIYDAPKEKVVVEKKGKCHNGGNSFSKRRALESSKALKEPYSKATAANRSNNRLLSQASRLRAAMADDHSGVPNASEHEGEKKMEN